MKKITNIKAVGTLEFAAMLIGMLALVGGGIAAWDILSITEAASEFSRTALLTNSVPTMYYDQTHGTISVYKNLLNNKLEILSSDTAKQTENYVTNFLKQSTGNIENPKSYYFLELAYASVAIDEKTGSVLLGTLDVETLNSYGNLPVKTKGEIYFKPFFINHLENNPNLALHSPLVSNTLPNKYLPFRILAALRISIKPALRLSQMILGENIDGAVTRTAVSALRGGMEIEQ